MWRLVGVFALGAQGCVVVDGLDGEELELTSVSTLYQDARGLELSDDGSTGLLGMSTTTCTVDTSFGMTGSDHDVAGDQDRVDAADCGPDNVDCDYLVTSGDDAFVVNPTTGAWDLPSRRFRGLVGATLVGDGVAALSERDGACLLDFAGRRALRTNATVKLPAEACADAVVEAGADGVVFVASDGGVWAVDATGQERIADPADALAWDEAAAVLYAADHDGDGVRALEPSGERLWDEPLDGAFVAFDDAGEHAGVLVMVEDDAAAGRLVLLDGVSGDRRLEESLPGVGHGVRVSADGSRVALLRTGEVMFFDLGTGEAAVDEGFELTIEDLDL